MAQELQAKDSDGIRVLTLNRPPGNTFTRKLLKEFRLEIEKASKDPGVRAIVFSSALEKYFSAGLDLEELTSPAQEECFRELFATYFSIAGSPKPVLAALTGSALLGGFIIALAADYRYIGRQGRIALNEIRLGLTPTGILIHALRRLAVDPKWIRALVFEGKALKAPEALEAGFVDGALPAGEVLGHTLAQARRLIRNPPGALAAVKASLDAHGASRFTQEDMLREFLPVLRGAEAQEGLSAAAQKRKPRW